MSLNKVELVWEVFDIEDLQVLMKHKSFISPFAEKVERIIRCPRCYDLLLSNIDPSFDTLPQCVTICKKCGSRLEISEKFVRCCYATTTPWLDRLFTQLNDLYDVLKDNNISL